MLVSAILTALFTIGMLFFYKLVINPQVVFTADIRHMAKCPDGWVFSITSQSCEPGYPTSCLPFKPDTQMLSSASARCNLARSCGTTWSGFCN
jgi:hypothetical protein